MMTQNKGRWTTMATVSVVLLLSVGAVAWMTQAPLPPEQHTRTDPQQNQRLVRLEQAMTALTQAVQSRQTSNASPESMHVAAPVNDSVSRQELTQLIRNELRQALANQSPEAQRAREEAIATAEILNTPENKAAYQSATSVVHTAVAAKRWTEEDKENFRAAFVQLTDDQRAELMKVLAPAINNGEVEIEVNGPLF